MIPWHTFQLVDSALPAGGFAHSGGLEAAVQLGHCPDAAALERFLRDALWNAGTFALPFVAAAHRDPGALAALDARCDAATVSRVANAASRVQGRAFLRAAAAAFGPAAEAIEEQVRAASLPGHLPPVFGAVAASLGIDTDEARGMFLFLTARGIVSAGVRLGVAGPLEAQGVLARAAEVSEAVLLATAALGPEAAAASAPLLELLQSHQDRLYARLFQS